MLSKSAAVIVTLSVLGAVAAGCGQTDSGRKMMLGGMMGSGMMGGPSSGNGSLDRPDPKSKGARLEGRYCGQCHKPPAPSVHRAKDWPQVVSRMKGHMATQGKSIPDPAQMDLILRYLQDHAG